MFKYDYQGGNFFEIFSAQGKDPTGQWKLQGGAGIRKVYEREVKSFVYNLEGTVATTKMQLPKDMKHSLSLVQRYLIFQLIVPKGGEFSMEIGVTDIGGNKRRLNMSTSVKEIMATPLHAKLPLTVLRKSVWVNCCCDMVNIVGDTWPGQTFGKIDSLSISANCKLRRIITMKNQPADTTDDDAIYGCAESSAGPFDSIPRQHQLAADINHCTQLINMHKIRGAETRLRGERPAPIDLDLSASGRRGNLNDSFHIAFGTKVGKPPTAVVGRKSTSSGLSSHRENVGRASTGATIRDSYDHTVQHTARLPRHAQDRMFSQSNYGGRQRLLSDPGKSAEVVSSSSNPLNESKSWSGADIQEQKQQEAAFARPHPPPRDSSAESAQRRKPKVRSGDRVNRTPADAHLKPLTNGHHHTVSAPSIPHKHNAVSQREDNSTTAAKLAPLKMNKTSYLDKKAQVPNPSSQEPKLHLNKYNLQPLDGKENITNMNSKYSSAVPEVWTSQTAEVKAAGGLADESVSDVIEALREKIDSVDIDGSDGEEDRLALIDSLEKFSADACSSSSDEESGSQPLLFQFKSPPTNKQALRSSNMAATAAVSKNLLGKFSEPQAKVKLDSLQTKADRPSELSVYGSVYSPSNYSTKAVNGATDALTPISGAEVARKTDSLQPRPPGSPRVSSRPGSGRLRSRHGSRASNHSNKPTPDSSGTGEDLSKALAGNKHIAVDNGPISDKNGESNGSSSGGEGQLQERVHLPSENVVQRLQHEEQLEGLPSPRASDKEPRISSAGRRGGSAGSRKSESGSKEEQLYPPLVNALRASDRGSPVNSSRGSTRVSRKSLREIPESDRRFIGAQHSSTSPTQLGYAPTAYRPANDTFDEEHMLQFLKKEQEVGGSIDEQNNLKRPVAIDQYEHEVPSDSEHSSDESLMTTSVPVIGSHDYKDEMQDTLERSDTRDLSVFSPPIMTAVDRKLEEHFSAADLSLSHRTKNDAGRRGKRSEQSSTSSALHSVNNEEDEEELDLIYDHVLNCYYDPVSHKYYELV